MKKSVILQKCGKVGKCGDCAVHGCNYRNIPVTPKPKKPSYDSGLQVYIQVEGGVSLMVRRGATYGFSKRSDALKLVKAIQSAMKASKR